MREGDLCALEFRLHLKNGRDAAKSVMWFKICDVGLDQACWVLADVLEVGNQVKQQFLLAEAQPYELDGFFGEFHLVERLQEHHGARDAGFQLLQEELVLMQFPARLGRRYQAGSKLCAGRLACLEMIDERRLFGGCKHGLHRDLSRALPLLHLLHEVTDVVKVDNALAPPVMQSGLLGPNRNVAVTGFSVLHAPAKEELRR